MNSVQLLGRLTKDPMQGNGVVTFTLAVDRHDKDNGADFPVVKVFGKQGETVCKYLKKGRMCAVDGRLETGSYQNRKGETVYFTDVIAGKVEFVGDKEKVAEKGKQSPVNDFEAVEEDVPF